MAEVRGSGTWSSALSTGGFAALRAVGFEPAGQVMGSAVHHVGRSGRFWGYHDCLCTDAWYTGATPIALSGTGAPSAGLVKGFDQARRSALGRMTAECSALGGDGVVAARLTAAPFAAQPDCLGAGACLSALGNSEETEPLTSFAARLRDEG